MVELSTDSRAFCRGHSGCGGICLDRKAETMMSTRVVAVVIASATLTAKADYLFTWHYVYPQFQKFQGSFEVTDPEMQPGATFNSDLFRNSISISSPEGITYRGDDRDWSDAYGSFSPNPNIFMALIDSSHSITLDVFANGPTFEGDLYEFFPGGSTVTEHGW